MGTERIRWTMQLGHVINQYDFATAQGTSILANRAVSVSCHVLGQ